MQPGKTLWLLKIHPGLPDLEALLYNLWLFFQKIFSLASLGINIFQLFPMNNLVYEECKDYSIFPHMITSWKDLWEFIIISKFNSFEILSIQSPQKSVRKIILNAKIIKNAIAFGALRQALSTGRYLLTLRYNCTLLCWQNLGTFF